jgi:hypothetical protein
VRLRRPAAARSTLLKPAERSAIRRVPPVASRVITSASSWVVHEGADRRKAGSQRGRVFHDPGLQEVEFVPETLVGSG